MRCPVTGREIPPGEEMDGHVIPQCVGGRSTVRTWREIDNKVGTLFDSELGRWIEVLATGRIDCEVRLPELIAGTLRRATYGIVSGRPDLKMHIPDFIGNRIQEAGSLSLNGTMRVELPNMRKVTLSLIHSAVLFIVSSHPRRSGNLELFRAILIKGMDNVQSISRNEWQEVDRRCIFTPASQITVGKKSVRPQHYDTVAFNYRNLQYGVCRLDGTFEKYPHGRIRSIFVVER